MTKLTVNLDIADIDGDALAAYSTLASKYGVELTVRALVGPGGGNADVDAAATRSDLALWLLEVYCDWDGDDVKDILNTATLVK